MSESFFVSSRRRHTRFDCDWSSDVCSSDLNFRWRARFFRSDVFCSWHRSPAGRGGIAGNDVIVSNCAALNVALRAPRTIGKDFAARGTIFCGIGINEQSGGALAFSRERLEAAIAVRIRVAHENDLASYADAVL